jgi:hypothetical protein
MMVTAVLDIVKVVEGSKKADARREYEAKDNNL